MSPSGTIGMPASRATSTAGERGGWRARPNTATATGSMATSSCRVEHHHRGHGGRSRRFAAHGFFVRWSHNQDPKARPNGQLPTSTGSSGNFGPSSWHARTSVQLLLVKHQLRRPFQQAHQHHGHGARRQQHEPGRPRRAFPRRQRHRFELPFSQLLNPDAVWRNRPRPDWRDLRTSRAEDQQHGQHVVVGGLIERTAGVSTRPASTKSRRAS